MEEIVKDGRVVAALIALGGVVIGGFVTFLLTWFKDSRIEQQKQKENERQSKRVKLEEIYMISKKMHDFHYLNKDYRIDFNHADPVKLQMLIHLYFRKELLGKYDKFAVEYQKIVLSKVTNENYDLAKFAEAFQVFMNETIKISKKI